MISLEQYDAFVTKLVSPASMEDARAKLITAGLGLAGEAGEVAEIAKKVCYHGMEWNEEVRQKMIKELSDVVWYLQFAATHVCGVSLQHIINTNFEKLSARYTGGSFSIEEFMAKENTKKE